MFDRLSGLVRTYLNVGSVPKKRGKRTVPAHVLLAPGASATTIRQVEQMLGHTLPEEYREFLLRWNGGKLYVEAIMEPYPRLFAAEQLPAEQASFSNPTVLVIGQLDDETHIALSGGDRTSSVYVLEEGQHVDAVLRSSPVARSLDEFLTRFVEAEGGWYWEPIEPMGRWWKDAPHVWRHASGVFLSRDQHPLSMYRIGLPQAPYAMTPQVAALVTALRDHLIGLGGQRLDPVRLGFGHDGLSWWFGFKGTEMPEVDPTGVAIRPPHGEGWMQLDNGLWTLSGSQATFWTRYSFADSRTPAGAVYSVTWSTAVVHPLVENLRRRLDEIGAYYQDEPDKVPEGYRTINYHWSKPGRKPPQLSPQGQA